MLIFPIVLGSGKRLFGEAARPAAFMLTRATISPSGVVIAAYARAGEITTGSFALDPPGEAPTKLERV